MKSANYWDRRALQRLTEAEKTSEETIKIINGMYNQAYKNIKAEIESIYKNYSAETGLDIQRLKTLLTKKETDKVWKTLEKQGLTKYIKKNYKARINRAEQIQAQIYAKIKSINPKEIRIATNGFKGVINESYYKTLYDISMGTGYDIGFSKIDSRMVDRLINSDWSGINYRDRLWFNNDMLASQVSELIGGSLISGQGLTKTMAQFKEAFGIDYGQMWKVERLVRTETNYFHNQAEADTYKELGIKKYVFVATLDNRTSEICQEHDGKVYNYKDMKMGTNFPPLHPNCRSKTRGYVEEYEKTLKRRARNPFTNKTELVENISYKEWKESHNI